MVFEIFVYFVESFRVKLDNSNVHWEEFNRQLRILRCPGPLWSNSAWVGWPLTPLQLLKLTEGSKLEEYVRFYLTT